MQNSERTLFDSKQQILTKSQKNSAVTAILKPEEKKPWIHPGMSGYIVDICTGM